MYIFQNVCTWNKQLHLYFYTIRYTVNEEIMNISMNIMSKVQFIRRKKKMIVYFNNFDNYDHSFEGGQVNNCDVWICILKSLMAFAKTFFLSK